MLGTLGLIATSNRSDCWIVSCYHVLGRPYLHGRVQPFHAGDEIHQPDVSTPHNPVDSLIATVNLDTFRHLDDRAYDAAAVMLDESVPHTNAVLGIAGMDRLEGVAPPRTGMKVIKSGGATGVTRGEVIDIRAGFSATLVEIDLDWDTDDDELTRPGDSGAVWIESATGMAVAMNCGESPSRAAICVVLADVLDGLGLKLQ